MQSLDPSEFDLIVVGTGLVESIVAAAACKDGKSVLQLDPAAHYGGTWAALHLDEFLSLITNSHGAPNGCEPQSGIRGDVECSLKRGRILRVPGASLGPASSYNIDLSPHLLYGAGPAISLLLGSGAHHYTEYKLLQGVFMGWHGQEGLRPVPSTRSEVFKDRTLTPLQKRTLMRFLKGCSEALQGQGHLKDVFDDRPFTEVMRQEGLDSDLQRIIVHGVLLQHRTDGLSAASALVLLRQYIESVGRYGPDAGPYLTPMYGCGELPQAFCRTAAVCGAVQVLRCGIAGLVFDEHRFECTGVELESGQVVHCAKLAGGYGALQEWIQTFGAHVKFSQVHRCVAVLDAPIVPGLQQAMVVVPPTEPSGVAVWALQLGHSTAVCPQRSWIVHLWAEGKSVSEDGQQRVRAVLESLADCGQLTESSTHAAADGATTVEASILEGNERACPTALLAAFFTLQTVRILPQQGSSPWPANVVLCPGPSGAVELSDSVAAAKECYWQLYPQQQHQTEDQSSGGHLPPAFPLDPQSVRDRGDEDSDEEAVMALQAALGAGIADGADRNEAAD